LVEHGQRSGQVAPWFAAGPLSRVLWNPAITPSSIISLMFDSNVGDSNEAALVLDIGKYGREGDRTCESFSDGPSDQLGNPDRI
jgi:hypothetical protein